MFSLNVPPRFSDSVYDTIRPLYISSRIFGYAPFSATITKASSNKIYLTNIDVLIFIIHVLTYISCTVLYFRLDIYDSFSSSKLLVIATQIQYKAGCLFCLAMMVVEFVFRTSFWNIIESLNDFDLKLLTLGKSVDHNKPKKFLKHFMTLFLLMYSTFTIYTAVTMFDSDDLLTLFLSMIFDSLSNGAHATVTSWYLFLIFNLKVRFEAINDCLRDESQLKRPAQSIEYINKVAARHKLVEMAQLHDKLTDIMGSVNRRFSIQVMILVACDFVFITFGIFSLYRVCTAASFNWEEFQGAMLLIVWILYFAFFLLTIIWLGSAVHSEGAYAGVLIHKIMNNCTDKQTVEKLHIFSQQLQHQVPIATCKLFRFDWTLLFTLVGATATYLTILIQFDLASNEHPGNNTKS